MAHRICLLYLAVASPLLLVLFLMPWPFSGAVFAVLVMGYPVALMVVGIGRGGGLSGLGFVLLVFFVLVEACVLGMLVLRGHVIDAPWFGGLPLAAAIQLYGLWFIPLLLVPIGYAVTFDRFDIKPEEIEHLKRLKKTPDGEH